MFGASKCGKCGNSSFKIQEFEARGAAYKMCFIQCTSCNTPAGVTTYYDPGVMLEAQKKILSGMQDRLASVEYLVNQIANVLNQRLR